MMCEAGDTSRTLPLYSDEAFELLSQQWLKVGWNQKHPYRFTWLGRPIIQLPEDIVRIQELLYQVRPDVLIETGVAHGGSLILYASLFQVMGQGRVIGIDIEIRPPNRRAIEQHELARFITLIEGSSIDPGTVARVRALLAPGERVLVVLDSCHYKDHVRSELELYGELVTPGSYLVTTDGYMKYLADVPRGHPDWAQNNPLSAIDEFLRVHPDFTVEPPPCPFSESTLQTHCSYWPRAFLRRKSAPLTHG